MVLRDGPWLAVAVVRTDGVGSDIRMKPPAGPRGPAGGTG